MQEATAYCTRQRTSAIRAVVEQQQVLKRQLSLRLLEACAALMKPARDEPLFALAVLARCQCHACHSLAMHLIMF